MPNVNKQSKTERMSSSATPPTSAAARYATYDEFWPFYVSQHLNTVCRRLHFVGTTLVLIVVASVLLGAMPVRALWLAPLAGYGFAWVGHFFFERNRPATFTYPLWSLRGDFHMYFLILLGRFAPHLERGRELAGRA